MNASELFSDGSGSTASVVRASAPQLIFSILLLANGFYLLLIGKGGFRITTACGFGLIACLLGWGILVDAMPAGKVWFDNTLHSDITVAASALGFYLLGFILGWSYLWPIGILSLGWNAGMSTSLGVLLLGHDLTIHSQWGQWLLIAVCGAFGFFAITIFSSRLMPLASGLTGAFCLFLAVDLLVNEDRGMSLGLRLVLDRNSAHRKLFSEVQYVPKVSTRAFIAASWAVGLLFAAAQAWIFTEPFIPTPASSSKYRVTEETLARHLQEQGQTRTRKYSTPIYRYFHRSPSILGALNSPVVEQPHTASPAGRPSEQVDLLPYPASREELADQDQRSARSTHSFISGLTQAFRAQWAGALSQYSSSASHRDSSILGPLKRREAETMQQRMA